MATIEAITHKTMVYAQARNKCLDVSGEYEAQIQALQDAHAKALKPLIATMTQHHEELYAMVQDSEAVFADPKSITVNGVKVGYQTGKDKLVVVDEAETIATIKDLIAKTDVADVQTVTMYESCIKVKESLNDGGLRKLGAKLLKKLGVKWVDATNDVLIKPQDTVSTKAFDALVKAYQAEIADKAD